MITQEIFQKSTNNNIPFFQSHPLNSLKRDHLAKAEMCNQPTMYQRGEQKEMFPQGVVELRFPIA